MRTSHDISKNHFSIRNLFFVLVTLSVILLCAFSFSAMATAGHTQAAQRQTQTTYESVYISGGDSLWSLAQQYRGTTDTEQFVEQMKALNGLDSDRIQAGAYLLVPVETVL